MKKQISSPGAHGRPAPPPAPLAAPRRLPSVGRRRPGLRRRRRCRRCGRCCRRRGGGRIGPRRPPHRHAQAVRVVRRRGPPARRWPVPVRRREREVEAPGRHRLGGAGGVNLLLRRQQPLAARAPHRVGDRALGRRVDCQRRRRRPRARAAAAALRRGDVDGARGGHDRGCGAAGCRLAPPGGPAPPLAASFSLNFCQCQSRGAECLEARGAEAKIDACRQASIRAAAAGRGHEEEGGRPGEGPGAVVRRARKVLRRPNRGQKPLPSRGRSPPGREMAAALPCTLAPCPEPAKRESWRGGGDTPAAAFFPGVIPRDTSATGPGTVTVLPLRRTLPPRARLAPWPCNAPPDSVPSVSPPLERRRSARRGQTGRAA